MIVAAFVLSAVLILLGLVGFAAFRGSATMDQYAWYSGYVFGAGVLAPMVTIAVKQGHI